jgi:predicted metal-dependent HD superfamily phosphohydrolase
MTLWDAWKHGFYGSTLDPGVSAEKLFSALIHKYSEEHRAYHSVFHLNFLLEEFQDYSNHIFVDEATRREMYLTILYHDAVYDIVHKLSGERAKPGDNEDDSIKYFNAHRILVNSKLREDITQNVISNIELSKYKNFKSECLFGDFDLASLGSSWHRYTKNSERVTAEFLAYFGSDEVFKGRLFFLEKILASDRIYFSDYFYMNYEAKARDNISRDVELLRKLV